MNFSRKMKAGVAALAAIATLGAGGVVASTAFAGGGGGNQPGTGGNLDAVQFWQYKDDASGAWGPATSLDSVRAAMNNAGVTLEGNGITKAQAALDQARTECETGFQRRHPGEGNGDCRVVAVGAVPAVIGGNYIYNGSGVASPTGTGGWYDNWNKYVAPGTYRYGSTVYRTSYPFDDDPSNSVDAIMRRNVEASSKPSIVVIVLDKYQPAPPSYHLSISTQAAEMSGQAGDTKDASDTITLSSDGSKTENVNGTATLHWRGIDGTEKTVAKQFTASNKGSATVSASFKDMDASWESWPAGKRWWDVDVAKQGNMAEAVSHKGENDGKESGEKTTTPPEKWLTNEAGDTVRDGNDSIASGSLYTAHIKAHSNASGKFWIYDTIDTKDVVIGGTEQDDVSKVTVTDANGNIVPADISIDDSIDGKRVVKAHATAPHSGLYTLNVPQSAKPTGGDYEINDGSVACWNGDNGTGSLADCQTGNSDSVGKVTPTPDKVWVLDESGALVAEDKQWTNQQGVDQKTFLVGDQVGVVVNGSIPAHLLNPLASYSITDDLTGSNQWIDWKSGKVFVDGKDETANFTIAIDRKAGTATATAKASYIAKTMFKNSASKVRFYLTGTIKKGATEGRKIQLTNKAYEKWNNETRPTNEPPVFVWTPNPNKAWAMKVGGKWQLTVDPTKTDKVGGDDKYYRLGDEVAAVISGTLPTGLGRVPEIAWTDDFANVDSILDLKDTSNIKVYEQDTTDEANAGVNDLNKTGRDVTDQFDITAEGTKVTVSAKDSYEAAQKDLKTAKQISVVIPFDVNFDTKQLLESYGKSEGDELNTCVDPKGDDLDNKGGQTVGGSTVDTNTPKICVTVPPIHKQVIAESSQGGDQSSIDAKTVFPGQTVEYTVRVDPRIPADQAYSVTAIKLSDTYSEYTTANKQTLEITDLGTGGIIPKTAYKVQWDEKAHSFEATFTKDWVAANWKAGSNPRVLLRFEAKVNEDAPTDKTVGNKAALTVNNGVTPSNKVENEPPVIKPSKQDTQKDPTISIDGKTALLGDKVYYRVNIDASRLTDTAYKVWRLGMTDDYDQEYLTLDAKHVEILDETGRDRTGEFNIQDKDGVLYAFAKTVDTHDPRDRRDRSRRPAARRSEGVQRENRQGLRPAEGPEHRPVAAGPHLPGGHADDRHQGQGRPHGGEHRHAGHERQARQDQHRHQPAEGDQPEEGRGRAGRRRQHRRQERVFEPHVPLPTGFQHPAPGPRLPDRHGLGRHGPAGHRVRPVPGQLGRLRQPRPVQGRPDARGQGREDRGQRLRLLEVRRQPVHRGRRRERQGHGRRDPGLPRPGERRQRARGRLGALPPVQAHRRGRRGAQHVDRDHQRPAARIQQGRHQDPGHDPEHPPGEGRYPDPQAGRPGAGGPRRLRSRR